ncbi:NTP transferase domain-containing protein [Acidianus sulfidivorans]|nr:NTP transferase domain-containing protein [Acidianus sulfidivorans]
MAGGKGSRLSNCYKPLFEVCGKPMILWVYDTLLQITDKRNIYVATLVYHRTLPIIYKLFDYSKIIFTRGLGYEYDIMEAVKKVGFPVLIVPSDTPFISKEDLLKLISSCDSAICNLLSNSGYIGISFWKSSNINDYSNIESRKEIINVNTREDLVNVTNKCKEGKF